MLKVLSFFLLLSLLLSVFPKNAIAQGVNVQCGNGEFKDYVQPNGVIFPTDPALGVGQAVLGQAFNITVTFGSRAAPNFDYYIKLTKNSQLVKNIDVRSSTEKITSTNRTAIFKIGASGINSNENEVGTFKATLMHQEAGLLGTVGRGEAPVCELGSINFFDGSLNRASFGCNVSMPPNVEHGTDFTIVVTKDDVSDVGTNLYIFKKSDIDKASIPNSLTYMETASTPVLIKSIAETIVGVAPIYNKTIPANNASGSYLLTIENSGGSLLSGGDYVVLLERYKHLGRTPTISAGLRFIPIRAELYDKWYVFYCSSHPFTVSSEPTSTTPTDGTIITEPGTGGISTSGGGKPGTVIDCTADPKKCTSAAGVPCGTDGLETAIGCVQTDPAKLIPAIIKLATGAAGGIALLLMIMGAFQMITSAGNPDALKAGQGRFTAAIIGLLFIIFSVLLLQIIGVDILNIPGFTR